MSDDNQSVSGFAYPNLYRLWQNHDLAFHVDLGSIRPWFYKSLKPEDEPRVWRFIEEHYLLKYKEILAVRFDWSSSGLWRIAFPGSVRYGGNICLEALGMPERAKQLLAEWHDPLDAQPYDGYEEGFDQAASYARGLAAAKEAKLSLGRRIYLEFRPFQEIVLTEDGKAEEVGVPEFILEVGTGNGS